MARDYYEVLGVARSASGDEIKSAYRKLAREHHPDRNPDSRDESARLMAEINQAYGTLSDSDKRAQYDRFGADGPGAGGGVDFGAGGFSGLNDIFDVFLGGVAASGQRERQNARRGADLRFDLELSLEDAWSGVSRELQVPTLLRCEPCDGSGAAPGTKPETCSACSGTGRLRQVRQTFFGQFVQEAPCARCGGTGRLIPTPCSTCRGEGRIRGTRDVRVQVPAGIDDGDRLRVPGAGEDAPDSKPGSAPGDLYCFVTLQEHAQFARDSETALCLLPITFPQAALGDTLRVPTLERDESGETMFTDVLIPAGTQGGARFRVVGKGFSGRGGSRGDQICVTRVVVPKNLSDRQKELLRDFAEESQEQLDEHPRGFFDRLKDAIRGD